MHSAIIALSIALAFTLLALLYVRGLDQVDAARERRRQAVI